MSIHNIHVNGEDTDAKTFYPNDKVYIGVITSPSPLLVGNYSETWITRTAMTTKKSLSYGNFEL